MTFGSISNAPQASHADLMDRMYRVQRHFYDITRKYYLFGRDRLITRLPVSDGQRICEVGCGTGRNLVLLARKHPQSHFYGFDAATVMVETAQAKLDRNQLSRQVQLRQGLAEHLDARAWFNVPAFDRIFFSYSLSMIPTWPAALEAALANLAAGGELWVVDFWDQAGYPRWFARLLKQWLAMFHVHFRPELLACLAKFQDDKRGTLTIEPIGRRYAYLARLVKRVDSQNSGG